MLIVLGETSSLSSEATKTTLTDSIISHLEITLKEKDNTISKLIGEVKHQKEEQTKMKQSYEAKLQKNKEKLQEKEGKLQEKEEKFQGKEEKLLEKEKEITDYLRVIARKEKEGKDF